MDSYTQDFTLDNLNDYNHPYYNSHNHNSFETIKTYVDPLRTNKVLIDKPINDFTYIYKSNSVWVLRQGRNTFGRFSTYDDALTRRNELIKDGIIKIRKITQKPKKQKKIQNPENSQILEIPETPKIHNNIEFNNDNLNIETQIQINNYINELEHRRSEINKHQNKIKTNMRKIITSMIKQRSLATKLDELDKRQKVLLDLVNIINPNTNK